MAKQIRVTTGGLIALKRSLPDNLWVAGYHKTKQRTGSAGIQKEECNDTYIYVTHIRKSKYINKYIYT
jgi:hypothetical protein